MSDEVKHIFGAKCPNCGHVSYYDKRQVCREGHPVKRGDIINVHDDVEPDQIAGRDVVERAFEGAEREAERPNLPLRIEGQSDTSDLVVRCPHCGTEFAFPVDCRDYL